MHLLRLTPSCATKKRYHEICTASFKNMLQHSCEPEDCCKCRVDDRGANSIAAGTTVAKLTPGCDMVFDNVKFSHWAQNCTVDGVSMKAKMA